MEDIIFKEVGKRLKQARLNKHISLEEAGKVVDVHKSTILRWENGEIEKIKLPILKALSALYDVNLSWLLGYDNEIINKDYYIKYKVPDKIQELINKADLLNDEGLKKLLSNLDDLIKIDDYRDETYIIELNKEKSKDKK